MVVLFPSVILYFYKLFLGKIQTNMKDLCLKWLFKVLFDSLKITIGLLIEALFVVVKDGKSPKHATGWKELN